MHGSAKHCAHFQDLPRMTHIRALVGVNASGAHAMKRRSHKHDGDGIINLPLVGGMTPRETAQLAHMLYSDFRFEVLEYLADVTQSPGTF